MMKCLVFDRGDGVLGIGLKILFGGIDQFCIAWPDRPPERMTHDFLLSNGVSILGEGELILPSTLPTEQVESMFVEPAGKLVEIDMDASALAGELVPVDPAPVAPTLVDPPTPVLEPIAPIVESTVPTVESTTPTTEPIAPVVESQPAPESAPSAEVPVEQPAVTVETTSAIDLV
jgi:hypothetical protein